jgi:WD40 repeat protein
MLGGLFFSPPLQGAPLADLSQEDLTKTILYEGGYIPDIDLEGNLLTVAAIETHTIYDVSQIPALQVHEYPFSTSRTTDIAPAGEWVAFNAFGGDGERTEVIPSWGGYLEVYTEGQYALVSDIEWVNDIVLEASRYSYTATREGNIWFAQDSDNPMAVMAHEGGVNSLSLSFVKRLASGGEDGVVKLWDGQTVSQTIEFGQAVKQVSWSPVIAQLAVRLADGSIQLWDAQQTQTLPLTATSIVWSSDGAFLALGQASGQILIWNVAQNALVTTLDAHARQVTALAWSGGRLASAGLDGKVHLWDVASWTIIQTIEPVQCCLTNLTSNGTLFLFQQQAVVWEWNNATQTLRPIFMDEIKLKDMVISPSGRYLAIRGYQMTPEYLALYERLPDGTYQLVATTTAFDEGGDNINAMKFAADDQSLIGLINRITDGKSEAVVMEWSIPDLTQGRVSSVVGSPDGALAIAPDGTVAFMVNEQALAIERNGIIEGVYHPLTAVFDMVYSDNGQYLAIGANSTVDLSSTQALDLYSWTCYPQSGDEEYQPFEMPSYAAFIAADSILVCANLALTFWDIAQNRAIQAYNIGTGNPGELVNPTATHGMAVSDDETQIFILYNDEFQVWQVGPLVITPTITPIPRPGLP